MGVPSLAAPEVLLRTRIQLRKALSRDQFSTPNGTDKMTAADPSHLRQHGSWHDPNESAGARPALGKLVAASALEVSPGQEKGFEGGKVGNLEELEKGLNEAAAQGKLDQGLNVTLQFNEMRISPVREAMLQLAFGASKERTLAATVLAERLGRAMDRRSSICLLVVSIHELADSSRQVVAWTFPRERVIRRSGGTVDINDAFSLNSRLRKAALLCGRNDRTGFLTARVLDQQTTQTDRVAADFWILGFLGGRQQIGTSEGTHMVAKVFRSTYERLDPSGQAKLQLALVTLRNQTDRQWSLETIATELLPVGEVRDEFLKSAGRNDQRQATFAIDPEKLDQLLGLHVFTLSNGILVIAPTTQIDVGVRIVESGEERTIHVEGVIVSEKLRKRA